MSDEFEKQSCDIDRETLRADDKLAKNLGRNFSSPPKFIKNNVKALLKQSISLNFGSPKSSNSSRSKVSKSKCFGFFLTVVNFLLSEAEVKDKHIATF